MALPTLVKTWQHNVNQATAAGATALATHQQNLFKIKQALIGFGSTPWTVVGSSNSSVAGMDGIDRWLAYTNLVWSAASFHSWIVLKQTGVAANFQICLDLIWTGGTDARRMGIFISPSAGFTGGSTAVRPTATDESGNQLDWDYGTISPFAGVVHVLQSSDGAATRVAVCYGRCAVGFWIIDKVQSPTTGWTTPAIWVFVGNAVATDVSTIATLVRTANTRFRHNTTNYIGFLTIEGHDTDRSVVEVLQTPDTDSGAWPMMPLGVMNTTANGRGHHGYLNDTYCGCPVWSTGTTYPADASYQFCQLGHIIVPWNGTKPVVR